MTRTPQTTEQSQARKGDETLKDWLEYYAPAGVFADSKPTDAAHNALSDLNGMYEYYSAF